MELKNPLTAVIAADQALPSCLLYQYALDIPSPPRDSLKTAPFTPIGTPTLEHEDGSSMPAAAQGRLAASIFRPIVSVRRRLQLVLAHPVTDRS